MEFELQQIDINNNKEWDKFVDKNPLGTIYHHSTWNQVLSRTFNYHPVNITVRDKSNKTIKGIIPLMMIQNPFTRKKRISSLPLTTFCDSILPEGVTHHELLNFLKNNLLGFNKITLKYLNTDIDVNSELSRQTKYLNHVIELDKSPELYFKHVLNKSFRRKIKKAANHGLQYCEAESIDDLKYFYQLLKISRKKHGIPPLPFSFFKNMWLNLQPKQMIFVPMVKYKNKIISADIVFHYKDCYYSEYSASNSKYYQYGPNQLLLWELIKKAYQNNIKYIDLGRTDSSQISLVQFKEKLGARPRLLNYYHYPDLPQFDMRRKNQFLKKISQISYIFPNSILDIEGRFIFSIFG